MRILICQLRNHGDIIRTFPLIDAIKSSYPDAYVGFTCFEEMISTCEICENIDIIISQPRLTPVKDTQDGTRILDCSIFENSVDKIKKKKFDIYIDLHGVFQSAVFGAMCNIPIRLGRSNETSKDGATLFYTDICKISDKEINRMERHFIVASKLLHKIKPIKIQRYYSDIITIFPGSSKKGILKRWDINRYIEVGEYYSKKRKVRFVIGPEEIELIEHLNKITDNNVIISNNWYKIEKIISESGLVIGNDGAYVHMAVWRNIPAVMICGPLSPTINGIWKYGKGITLTNSQKCICKNVWSGICDNNHMCLEGIKVQDVINAIEGLEWNTND